MSIIYFEKYGCIQLLISHQKKSFPKLPVGPGKGNKGVVMGRLA